MQSIKDLIQLIFEFCFALFILILSSPVLIFVCAVVAYETRATPIFVQWRVGKKRVPFRLFKIRTMKLSAPTTASHQVNSQFVTRSGHFVRKFKLDEIPQLLNVIFGQMSLVGPRPCLTIQHELIDERDKRGVYIVKPGITGLSQIRGIDMSDPVRLATSDAEYVASRNFGVDLSILWKTILGKGRGDRVRSTEADRA